MSEAHALVSLRGGEFVLFGLRGRVRVDGRDVPRVTLSRGLRIELARGVELAVEQLRLPNHILAVEAPGLPLQALTGVVSFFAAPQPHLAAGAAPDAPALLFSDGLSWFLRVGSGRPRRVRAGDEVTVDGAALRFVDLAVSDAGTPETGPVQHDAALSLVTQGASVQVWPAGATSPCVLSGQGARLVTTLLAKGGPMRWEALAEALWEGEEADEVVRHRLDVVLGKVRRRLEEAGVRRDLITAHHNGFLELLLYPGDQAHDRT